MKVLVKRGKVEFTAESLEETIALVRIGYCHEREHAAGDCFIFFEAAGAYHARLKIWMKKRRVSLKKLPLYIQFSPTSFTTPN